MDVPSSRTNTLSRTVSALALVEYFIALGEAMAADNGLNQTRFHAWKKEVCRVLVDHFGPGSPAVARLQPLTPTATPLVFNSAVRAVTIDAVKILSELRSRLGDALARETCFALVLTTLRRFDIFAQAVSRRRRKGKTSAQFQLRDEYDVQDALYGILKPHIADLDREDPTPKVAGDSGRTDLSSRSAGLVIEVKRVRTAAHAKKLAAECSARLVKYGEIEGLRVLVFFVFDPEGLISDPDNFAAQIGKGAVQLGQRSFEVKCIISPRKA